ncbi:MAG: lysophospholipid acyltransferase family protein [Luteibaculaceae bacterium]
MFLASFIKLLSRLPMSVLYGISSLLYYVMFYGFGYRKKLIRENIAHAFPELSEKERIILMKKYYRYFNDFVVEVLKSFTETAKERKPKLVITNPQIFEQYHKANKGHITVMGHMGNWEFCSYIPSAVDVKMYVVYKPLSNKPIDNLILDARERFGCILIPMAKTRATLMAEYERGNPFFGGFISDQSPAPEKTTFWCSFMGRVVPWYTGSAELAIKTKSAFSFTRVRRLKRGQYQISCELIAEDASLFTVEELMTQFVRKLEENIREQPEIYLWTHKRWKHVSRVAEFEGKEGVTVIR